MFMNLTASAATALALTPTAFTEDQERKTPVSYPDPAVEIVDPEESFFRFFTCETCEDGREMKTRAMVRYEKLRL